MTLREALLWVLIIGCFLIASSDEFVWVCTSDAECAAQQQEVSFQ